MLTQYLSSYNKSNTPRNRSALSSLNFSAESKKELPYSMCKLKSPDWFLENRPSRSISFSGISLETTQPYSTPRLPIQRASVTENRSGYRSLLSPLLLNPNNNHIPRTHCILKHTLHPSTPHLLLLLQPEPPINNNTRLHYAG